MAEASFSWAILGDIGGTNARLELTKVVQGSTKPEVVKSVFYRTNDYAGGLYEVLELFLNEFRSTDRYPTIGVIAVACPVNQNCSEKFANSIWPPIDGAAVGKKFGLTSFTLLNDFEAIGHALSQVGTSDVVVVTEGKSEPFGIKAVVGPGTGLGVAYVGKSYNESGKIINTVYPTEGGHTQFPASDEEEAAWGKYFLEKNPQWTYFHTEQAFCGPSIPHMYNFFALKEGTTEPTKLKGEDIFNLARKGSDPIARKTLDFSLRIYGEYLSNMAITLMPRGGIYLTGGVTASLQEEILKVDGPFLKAFYNKGFLNSVLKLMPVFIVKIVELGLLGCFSMAGRLLYP